MAEKISSFNYYNKTPAMVITVNHCSIAPLCLRKKKPSNKQHSKKCHHDCRKKPVKEVEQQEKQEAGLRTMNKEEDKKDEYGADDEDDGHIGGEGKASNRKLFQGTNQISARESRKRKKTMIEELQRTVITLSRENKDLNERNEQFRTQLMEIGAKVSENETNSVWIDKSPCLFVSYFIALLF
jgi:hypothetical protein